MTSPGAGAPAAAVLCRGSDVSSPRLTSLPSLGGSILTPLPSLPARRGVTRPGPGPFLPRRPSNASPGWRARDLCLVIIDPAPIGIDPAPIRRAHSHAKPEATTRRPSTVERSRRCESSGQSAPRSQDSLSDAAEAMATQPRAIRTDGAVHRHAVARRPSLWVTDVA